LGGEGSDETGKKGWTQMTKLENTKGSSSRLPTFQGKRGKKYVFAFFSAFKGFATERNQGKEEKECPTHRGTEVT